MGKKKKKLDKVIKETGDLIRNLMRNGKVTCQVIHHLNISNAQFEELIHSHPYIAESYNTGLNLLDGAIMNKTEKWAENGVGDKDMGKVFLSHYHDVMEKKPVEKIEITENTATKRGTPEWLTKKVITSDD